MTEFKRANSFRIIGSAVYDGLIILGLLMIAGFVAVGLNYLITGQETISSNNILFQAYLLVIVCSYFLYFWKKNGQTVGMKAWRLKLIPSNDQNLSVSRLLLRILVALPAYALGLLGVFWQYWDKAGLNWHDRASHSKIVHIPKH